MTGGSTGAGAGAGPRPAPGPRRPSPLRGQSAVVAVVSVGGALGACARYGAGLLWPTAPGAFPWTTLVVNALGCAVIGVFMVVITEVRPAHRLVRPFFGTGVLGGFTTFSTFAVDTQRLLTHHQVRAAVLYLAGTVTAALLGVALAAAATRGVMRARMR
nr:fluoride efflux transporter CrcB [Streptomyces sp. SID5468]